MREGGTIKAHTDSRVNCISYILRIHVIIDGILHYLLCLFDVNGGDG